MPRPPTPTPSPPLSGFPYTTGSFDFPQASSPAHGSEVSPRRTTRLSRRRALHRLFGPPRDSDVADDLSRRPPTANPNRPHATPSERYLRRSQARIRELREDMDALESTLASYPSNTNRPTHQRSPVAQTSSERRHKRRKLDHDPSPKHEYTCFKYGHKGQVVPGRLRMEVVSCDGGEHRKDNPPGLYKVQNVLRNDKSVYCSESSQCNLLLKHIGEAPFALNKVIIRAPDRGFTAPVQEGLVFVSMSAEELLASTSSYNLLYGSQSPDPPISPAIGSPPPAVDNEQISFREAMEDPLVWQYAHEMSQRELSEHHEPMPDAADSDPASALRSDPERRRILYQMLQHENETDSDPCDHATEHSYHRTAGISAPTPPPFTVTTASEEEASDSDEDIPSAATMADRLRRESRWRSENEPDGNDILSTSRFGRSGRNYPRTFGRYSSWTERAEAHLGPIQASRVREPNRIVPAEPPSHPESLIAPHAKFFIAKNKNKITIKFHPAISGKHVLLKFWSPQHDGNIDIESVQFYGYSGPRYFPATQPR